MHATPTTDLDEADEDLLRDTDLTEILTWRDKLRQPGALHLYECSKDMLLDYFDRIVALCHAQRRRLAQSDNHKRMRELERTCAEQVRRIHRLEIMTVPGAMREEMERMQRENRDLLKYRRWYIQGDTRARRGSA